jgi:hypothetical protein
MDVWNIHNMVVPDFIVKGAGRRDCGGHYENGAREILELTTQFTVLYRTANGAK